MSTTIERSLDLEQRVHIAGEVGVVFRSLIRRLTLENSTPDNQPLPMVLEEWPGGRWFRDLGDDQGHLWGHVQVIKPPTLLELHGPMFMSYAVAGHIQFRLTESNEGVELYLRHQVVGPVEDAHRQGVVPGWQHLLEQTKRLAESNA